jgi:Uma2 family endonuclease
LLTAADLAAFPTELPSGSVRWELFDGELVAMSPPGEIHGRRQAKVVSALDAVAETALGLGRVWGEVGIVLRRGPDRVVGADAAFVLTRSLPVRRSREGYLDTIPELVVEVVSKNDTGPEVRDKVAEYLAAGVRMVWKLEPDAQTVTVHRPDQPDEVFGPADTLACPDLLPGFAVPVAKLFPAD